MFILFITCIIAEKIALHDWQFSETGTNRWYKANVPSNIHMDLLDNGLIDDPFINDNIDKIKYLESMQWTYTTKFDAQKGFDQTRLIFEGLDTHVDVYLNGKQVNLIIIQVLKTDNYHRTWIVNLINFLAKDNILILNFYPASVHDLQAAQQARIPLPTNYAYSRKAAYHYGWDFGPKIVTCGIWKPVYLEQTNIGAIRSIHLRTLLINKLEAKVQIQVKVQFFRRQDYQIYVIIDNRSQIVNHTNSVLFHRQNFVFDFTMKDARLWWPVGQGEQNLYNITVELRVNQQVVTSSSILSGIRRAKWSDDYHLTLNGRDIYVKGANYVPPDMFIPRMMRNPQKYDKIFEDAINAGYNGLRIWGGGQFEYDLFYDLADKYGILIWHDLMFASTMYPLSIFDTAIQEIKNNVIRLRTHPSIVLWNGNSEIKEGQLEWGFNFGTAEQASVKIDWYNQLFNKIIPQLLQILDPDTFYMPTTPSVMANAGQLNGVVHYWGVWAKGADIETYRDNVGRFNSEYGMQAIPELSSIKKYINNSADRNMSSKIFQIHERHYRGITLLNLYMGNYTKNTTNFFHQTYNSQIVQHLSLQTAIESLRGAKPYNMGSFYWQMSDVWPGVTWSTIDYYGCYKAGHYAAKQAHAPILLVVKYRSTLQIFANNDMPIQAELVVNFQLINFDGEIEHEFREIKSTALAGSNDMIFEYGDIGLFGQNYLSHYLHLNLRYNNITVDSSYIFARPKDLLLKDPQLSMTVNKNFITLQAKKLAKYVYLYNDDDCLVLDDNYFDIYPGIPKVLKNLRNYTQDDIKFMSFFDVF